VALKIKRFDAAEHLKTDEAITAFVDEAFKTADAAFIASALGVAARARGKTRLAREAGLLNEDSRGAIKSGHGVKFAAIVRVMHALGLRLGARPLVKKMPKRRAKVTARKKGE
jgi:probable addiction module antidote protein